MEITAKNRISGRVAQAITATANRSGYTVLFKKDGRTVNAGSLLGILSLVIAPGDVIDVTVEGDSNILNTIKDLL